MKVKSKEVQEDYYSSFYEGYKTKGDETIIVSNITYDLVKDLDFKTVADIGSAQGLILKRLNKEGVKVYGFDINKKSVAHLNSIGIKAKVMDASKKFPIKNNSFDLVISNCVLPHITNPEFSYKELIRISKKYLLVEVENDYHLNQRWLMLKGWNSQRKDGIDTWESEHLQHFNYYSFEKFIRKQNVKVIKKYTDFGGFTGCRFMPRFMKDALVKTFPNLFGQGLYFVLEKK